MCQHISYQCPSHIRTSKLSKDGLAVIVFIKGNDLYFVTPIRIKSLNDSSGGIVFKV